MTLAEMIVNGEVLFSPAKPGAIKIPPSVPPSAEFRTLCDDLKIGLQSTPVFVVSNVAQYLRSLPETEQKTWEPHRLPTVMPPFNPVWFEFAVEHEGWGTLRRFGCLMEVDDAVADEHVWPMRSKHLERVVDQLGETGVSVTPEDLLVVGCMVVAYHESGSTGVCVLPHPRTLTLRKSDGKLLITHIPVDFGCPELELGSPEASSNYYQVVAGLPVSVACIAISMIHCRNTEIFEVRQNPKLIKARRRRKPGFISLPHHLIEIQPTKKVTENDSGQRRRVTAGSIRHKMGHFKDYRSGKGLFGQLRGIWWWDSVTEAGDQVQYQLRRANKELDSRWVRIKRFLGGKQV